MAAMATQVGLRRGVRGWTKLVKGFWGLGNGDGEALMGENGGGEREEKDVGNEEGGNLEGLPSGERE